MRNEKLVSAIEVLRYRYRWLNKKKKGQVLDELGERFSVDRKYLMRLLSRRKGGRPKARRKGGRPSRYRDPQFQQSLRKVCKVTKYMCGKYLKKAMLEWLPAYEHEYGAFSIDIHERLLAISAATIDRHLKPFKAGHGLTFTRPGGVLRSEIQ